MSVVFVFQKEIMLLEWCQVDGARAGFSHKSKCPILLGVYLRCSVLHCPEAFPIYSRCHSLSLISCLGFPYSLQMRTLLILMRFRFGCVYLALRDDLQETLKSVPRRLWLYMAHVQIIIIHTVFIYTGFKKNNSLKQLPFVQIYFESVKNWQWNFHLLSLFGPGHF